MLTELITKLTRQYIPEIDVVELNVNKGYSGNYIYVTSRLFSYSPVDYNLYIEQMVTEFKKNPFGSAFKYASHISTVSRGTASSHDISDENVLSLFWKETVDSGIYTAVFKNVLEIKWIFEMQ